MFKGAHSVAPIGDYNEDLLQGLASPTMGIGEDKGPGHSTTRALSTLSGL